jgi:hypothetical protein
LIGASQSLMIPVAARQTTHLMRREPRRTQH